VFTSCIFKGLKEIKKAPLFGLRSEKKIYFPCYNDYEVQSLVLIPLCAETKNEIFFRNSLKDKLTTYIYH
jgi:hypothetical protein